VAGAPEGGRSVAQSHHHPVESGQPLSPRLKILGLGKLGLRGTKWSERRVPIGGHSPKSAENWRSSSPSQHRSSPHEAERRDFASLTTLPTARCGRPQQRVPRHDPPKAARQRWV
jgi:hypothetical protein